MRKNIITKIMTLAIAATMALTPVTASAAEKTVITATEFKDTHMGFYSDDYEDFDASGYYKYVSSLNGSYQENGYKIYTALNGKTVTVKKTGNYSVIVGGKTAKKDEGTFKFVAPKTGTYKFTFTTKNNVAGGQIYIDQATNLKIPTVFKVNYTARYDKSYKATKSPQILLTNNSKSVAYIPYGRGLSDVSDNTNSHMTKISGSFKMKKGQWFTFTGRDCGARYDETDDGAYNFTGFDVQITKTK